MNNLRTLLILFLVTVLAGACARPVRVDLPEPVRSPRSEPGAPAEQALVTAEAREQRDSLERTPTPTAPDSGAASAGIGETGAMPPVGGEMIDVNIDGIPVPAFINEFFGTILEVDFQMDPKVAQLNDLVTLRTSSPQTPREFYQLAVEVLRTYGVKTEYQSGRVLFTPAGRGGDFQPPLVLSGRALPHVPTSHRPVFHLVELQAVRTRDVTGWLKTAFNTDELSILDDLNRNAVVLYGKPDLVRQAAAAVRVFDRPYMRSRVSTRLEPAFVGAEELARRLVDVLVAEGYGATLHSGSGVIQAAAVVVLPIAASNTILIFASDEAVLDHAVEWSRTIDQPNPTASGNSLFYYRVKNTRAEDIVATLNGVRSAASAARVPAREALSSAEAAQAAAADQPPVRAPQAAGAQGGGDLSAGTLVLDEPRNAVIFQGEPADWGRLLPLIRQMDRAARQVMIEVTIAEVTLDEDEEFGVSWLANNDVGRFNGTVTSGQLGGGGGGGGFGGLTYLLDIAGQARAQLRAFAEDNRVTVLSTPRLMVKSGQSASIDVGTEIPTISAQSASSQQTDGTSNILQSVQYRKTGIILDIQPVVYSDNRVDLEVRQEVSEALPLGTDSAVQSPSIFNRAVSTNLSLRDGSSVLIGGLMSRRATTSEGGVPYLKDIPLLGNVFKSSGRTSSKTELIVMIVPYIIETDAQATALTRSIGERYETLDLPNTPAELLPVPSVPVDEGGRP